MLGGKVMLVDLNMDDAAESSETSPGGLMYLNPSSREVARLRRKGLGEGNHLVIELNIGGGAGADKFVWQGVTFNSEMIQVRFNTQYTVQRSGYCCLIKQLLKISSLQVTCLEYIPQLGCLAVGYNLGVWTLVSLASMDILHVSSLPGPEAAPVTGLAWQEPLDDPRPSSYLWVMRSGLGSLASASMFSLTFSQRKLDSVEGPCYEGLEHVNLRFEHLLTGINKSLLIFHRSNDAILNESR